MKIFVYILLLIIILVFSYVAYIFFIYPSTEDLLFDKGDYDHIVEVNISENEFKIHKFHETRYTHIIECGDENNNQTNNKNKKINLEEALKCLDEKYMAIQRQSEPVSKEIIESLQGVLDPISDKKVLVEIYASQIIIDNLKNDISQIEKPSLTNIRFLPKAHIIELIRPPQ